jgi:flagellar hook protein FlgE
MPYMNVAGLGGAMAYGLSGMAAAQQQLEGAAKTIVNISTEPTGDIVDLSAAVVALSLAKNQHATSAAVVRNADELLGQTISLLA